jgi:ABC-type glycerol-3-phosphate transport system permease component
MLFPKVGRSAPETRRAFRWVVGLLWLGVILHLLPFYYMLSTSLKPAWEARLTPPTPWPQHLTFEAWESTSLPNRELRNSLIIAAATLCLSLPVTSLAAYANSKLTPPGRARWGFLYFIGTLMVPSVITLIPAFLLTRNFPFPLPVTPSIPGTETPFPVIRTWNTWWALVLPAAFSAFNFLLFKGYFDTIPNSVLGAARVDGASELNIFRRIVLPMSVPVYAVAAWLQFGVVWDAYLWPTVVLRDGELFPLALRVGGMIDAFELSGQPNRAMAWALLNSLPLWIAFLLAREFLMKGIRVRGLR